MTIKIDKNVKIPPRSYGGGAPSKYPWKQMKVGDSFAVDLPSKRLASAANAARRATGMRFVVRATSPTSCRIWRVE